MTDNFGTHGQMVGLLALLPSAINQSRCQSSTIIMYNRVGGGGGVTFPPQISDIREVTGIQYCRCFPCFMDDILVHNTELLRTVKCTSSG